MGTLVGENC